MQKTIFNLSTWTWEINLTKLFICTACWWCRCSDCLLHKLLTCSENLRLMRISFFLFFSLTLAWMWNRVHANNWKKYAGRRRPRINYGLRLLLFFFNLLQRVCLASLLPASVPFLTRCRFPPHRSPSPCCHRQEGSEDKRRAETPRLAYTHCTSKENRKTQTNLQRNS